MAKKVDNLKERLYKQASDYVFQRGIKGWNMDDLASGAGVTKRTLYKAIPSKEQLIEEVVLRFVQDVQGRISQIIESEPDYFTAMEKIIGNFPLFVDRLNSKIMSDIFLEYPEIEEHVYQRRDELTARLVSFFKSGIDRGYLRKDVRPELVLQMFQAFVLYFIRFASHEKDYSGRMKSAFQCLLYGIASSRRPPRAG